MNQDRVLLTRQIEVIALVKRDEPRIVRPLSQLKKYERLGYEVQGRPFSQVETSYFRPEGVSAAQRSGWSHASDRREPVAARVMEPELPFRRE